MAAFMKYPLWSGSGLGGLFEMGADRTSSTAPLRLLLMAQRGASSWPASHPLPKINKGDPLSIRMGEGNRMGSVTELRPRGESEKITINLGYVDLGHIDLLVQEGFYSNRTDFIRTAIRNQLDRQAEAVKQAISRHQLDLGLRQYNRQDLEAVQAGR